MGNGPVLYSDFDHLGTPGSFLTRCQHAVDSYAVSIAVIPFDKHESVSVVSPLVMGRFLPRPLYILDSESYGKCGIWVAESYAAVSHVGPNSSCLRQWPFLSPRLVVPYELPSLRDTMDWDLRQLLRVNKAHKDFVDWVVESEIKS